MNPAMLLRAMRLTVVPLKGGDYRIAGESGTYTVSPTERGLRCTCLASNAPWCSHRVRVHIHLENPKVSLQ